MLWMASLTKLTRDRQWFHAWRGQEPNKHKPNDWQHEHRLSPLQGFPMFFWLNCLSKRFGTGASFFPLDCGLKASFWETETRFNLFMMRRIWRRDKLIPCASRHFLILLAPYLDLFSRKMALIFSSSSASDIGYSFVVIARARNPSINDTWLKCCICPY